MPKTKNAELRIKVIDQCLSDRKRKYTTAMIFQRCNEELEKRDFFPITAMNSVRDDIDQIQRIYPGAEVESYREGRNIYYRYADPEFSIFKTPMKPDEIIQLTQTLRLLRRFKGMPQFNWVDEIAERLGASLKLDETTDEIVGFDENLDLEGMDNFTPLFNAIVDKHPLKLTYQSFKQDREETVVVHPYYLKQYNKRWFLIAWNDEKDFMANYAFDRIKGIENANVAYKPTDVNFFDYFEDMIGVSKDTRTEPQIVKLWVSPEQWPYIKTKPLHGATQRLVSMDEKSAVITIEVYLNYELEQQLLSFGEKVKVLEPGELKERIKQRLTEAAKNYLE
jgi:predicted DNA-binding transcriptional regulator YafY